MSSNSSGSEDELEKIKEAVDGSFLTEDLYAEDQSKKKSEKPLKLIPSLRNQTHQEVSINPFAVKVTPEFQSHVSKHLSKLLDELIDDSQVIQKNKKFKIKGDNKSGVKLLSSSNDFLTSTSNCNVSIKRLIPKRDLTEIDYEERAKEVAVSPEWVFSKKETTFWAPETRGKIEVMKLDDNYGKIKYKKKTNV